MHAKSIAHLLLQGQVVWQSDDMHYVVVDSLGVMALPSWGMHASPHSRLMHSFPSSGRKGRTALRRNASIIPLSSMC